MDVNVDHDTADHGATIARQHGQLVELAEQRRADIDRLTAEKNDAIELFGKEQREVARLTEARRVARHTGRRSTERAKAEVARKEAALKWVTEERNAFADGLAVLTHDFEGDGDYCARPWHLAYHCGRLATDAIHQTPAVIRAALGDPARDED
jgi:hypothetical protein